MLTIVKNPKFANGKKMTPIIVVVDVVVAVFVVLVFDVVTVDVVIIVVHMVIILIVDTLWLIQWF